MNFPRLSSTLRKGIFVATKKIVLGNRIKNFSYQWAWTHLRNLDSQQMILDIGSRDSTFPAFLAWRKFEVTIVEQDKRFNGIQKEIAKNWVVRYNALAENFVYFQSEKKYHAVLSLFSLQHAGDDDRKAYGKITSLLHSSGVLLTVNEYNPEQTRWHRNRDDGDLRIYGPKDLETRIEAPLENCGMKITEKKFAEADFKQDNIKWRDNKDVANICFICAKK